VNCDSTDTFHSVWRKILSQVQLLSRPSAAGFGEPPPAKGRSSTELLNGEATPDGVKQALTFLSQTALLILIVDEFDRLPQPARLAFADTIKTLSDHTVEATVVRVGVADSVEQLIAEHQSVERALVQIQMPRMPESEIMQILTTGVERLGMSMDSVALRRIARLAQGLPHYAHLLGLHGTRVALDRLSMSIDTDDVGRAIEKALQDAQHSVRSAYHEAIRSPRKDNLYADALLACALAPTSELGFFAPQGVRGPMRTITGKSYEIPSFAQHLNEFSEPNEGQFSRRSACRGDMSIDLSTP
jgi:hypothetical protein